MLCSTVFWTSVFVILAFSLILLIQGGQQQQNVGYTSIFQLFMGYYVYQKTEQWKYLISKNASINNKKSKYFVSENSNSVTPWVPMSVLQALPRLDPLLKYTNWVGEANDRTEKAFPGHERDTQPECRKSKQRPNVRVTGSASGSGHGDQEKR